MTRRNNSPTMNTTTHKKGPITNGERSIRQPPLQLCMQTNSSGTPAAVYANSLGGHPHSCACRQLIRQPPPQLCMQTNSSGSHPPQLCMQTSHQAATTTVVYADKLSRQSSPQLCMQTTHQAATTTAVYADKLSRQPPPQLCMQTNSSGSHPSQLCMQTNTSGSLPPQLGMQTTHQAATSTASVFADKL